MIKDIHLIQLFMFVKIIFDMFVLEIEKKRVSVHNVDNRD